MRVTFWRRRRHGRPDVRADVDAELQFHFQERTEALIAEGFSPEAAAARAQQEFGDTEDVRRRLTSIDARMAARRRLSWTDVIGQDLRYAIRTAVAAPGFTLLVVATLALGIGANGALFSLVDRLFVRPPPGVGEPPGLLRVYRRTPPGAAAPGRSITRYMHYPGFRDIVANLPADLDLTAYADSRVPIGRGEDPPEAHMAWVAPRYFSVLRAGAPALGRYPTDAEAAVDATAALVVISYAQWIARYGGDPEVIGRTIELSRTPHTTTGVAPSGFAGLDPDAVDFWAGLGSLPAGGRPWYRYRNDSTLRVLVRRGRRSPQQLESLLTAAYRSGAPPRESSFGLVTGPLAEARGPMPAADEAAISTRLAGVALLVLVIACANVANLLLARSAGRRREIAVRVALGASRARLAGLFLVESLVLSLLAAMASLAVAAWGGAAIRRLLLPDATWAAGVLDVRLAMFTFAAALVTALLTGVFPAFRAGRQDALTPALKTDLPTATGRAPWAHSTLLTLQVALSLVLLVGAGAFLRSLLTVASARTGYDTERLLVIRLRYDDGRFRRDRTAELLLDRVLPALRGHGGVERAAVSGMQPLAGYAMNTLFRSDGTEIPSAGDRQPAYLAVSPEFFQTAGIALVRGRDVDARDTAAGAPVMVVNQAMAETLWPAQDALGECVRIGRASEPCVTVVGVVENTHRDGLIDAHDGRAPMYFVPHDQSRGEFGSPVLALVRGAVAAEPRRLAGVLRDHLRPALPDGVYASVTPMLDSFEPQLRPWVVGSTLFSVFGLLALAVASVGTYSGLAYSVARRTREMGIRLALGAPPLRVVRLVMVEGFLPVAAGLVGGVALARASGRAIAALLYRTSPSDPAVIATAILAMAAAAAVGCLVPALKATRVDPAAVLRSD